MNVFKLRDKIICEDYASYTSSFIEILDKRIHDEVDQKFREGLLWPEPLLQLNPFFASGGSVDELVQRGILHPQCGKIFRMGKSEETPDGLPMQLYRHQTDAIAAAQSGDNYVLTTGTGSGKSLSYIIPIVDHVLKHPEDKGIKAIVVYPMNALANSQELELEKFLVDGSQSYPVSYRRYTGQEKGQARQDIVENPPDILLTNYVMLELILTRPYERKLVEAAKGLKFLVFDELHTYRGRQGADVAMLIRRLRETLCTEERLFQCIGTSATLAGPGSVDAQQKEVAAVATKLFGSEVLPNRVILETLRSETNAGSIDSDAFKASLAQFIASGAPLPESYGEFIRNPLVVWIENTIGTTEKDGRLVRCKPRPLKGKDGLSESLAEIVGVAREICETAIKNALLAGSRIEKPGTGKFVFAFKLHQFVSKGDTVYATLEPEDTRYITLFGQKLSPNHKEQEVPLFPLAFCRECGKEYYTVARISGKTDGTSVFVPANLADLEEEEGIKGYLFVDAGNPWPDDVQAQLDRIPEDWIEEKNGKLSILKSRKRYLPEAWYVLPDGRASRTKVHGATPAWFMPEPFVFCPTCHVSYQPRLKEFTKLATLGSEGRSTATTILSMTTVYHLRGVQGLDDIAQKLLCFTDNRQDASLQSGHFNDFVEVGFLRSALYNALAKAGSKGLGYGELPRKVFEAFGMGYANGIFPRELYAVAPNANRTRMAATDKTFRSVLEYRIYSDLQRGWRIVAPNLEQCGLLKFEYLALDDICADDNAWAHTRFESGTDAALARGCELLFAAGSDTRKKACVLLLDLLRSHLAIKTECLDISLQDDLLRESRVQLIEPWRLGDDGPMRYSAIAFPRAELKEEKGRRSDLFISPRGNFGRWLKKRQMFPTATTDDVAAIILALFKILAAEGLLDEVPSGKKSGESGYQLSSTGMIWKPGDGTEAKLDIFRVQHAQGQHGRTNPFFVKLYKEAVTRGFCLKAREHTAQVPSDVREEREEAFRTAKLPILYCSPTMELGVDISQLNAVGMRNVPPTPANYAQRSGRAGRSGQPALIITYCALGNSHDQHFFRSPEEMVAGAVSTPRLDLANEDLLRAHVYALWLSACGLDLHRSLADLLDLESYPALDILPSVKAHLTEVGPKIEAADKAKHILRELDPELANCSWYHPSWLKETMSHLAQNFEQACERWRALYRAATHQQVIQNQIANDFSRTYEEQNKAKQLREEAEEQRRLLSGSENIMQADFYSYRYFASEGFLPGYNFPRLPLSAYIPAGGDPSKRSRDEYISRPRFLAISEFGPESILYHEGSKYAINRVLMDVDAGGSLTVTSMKHCTQCGWLEHDTTKDICDMCGSRLPAAVNNLFRMRNVTTKRRERINSDEEERMRFGYQIVSGYRFETTGGATAFTELKVYDQSGMERLLTLKYGHSATLWRINMGWSNRKPGSPAGFLLDRSTGIWASRRLAESSNTSTDGDADGNIVDQAATLTTDWVIPYVEDRKNCLIMEPGTFQGKALTLSQMVSLQSALKQAILQIYQLEDNELSCEILPSRGDPRTLLFYESAEGGAGVLRHLVEDANALSEAARTALEICHFDPCSTPPWEDLGKAERASEPCVAACYDCLMNYGNQRWHKDLDRQSIKDFLIKLLWRKIQTPGKQTSRTQHLADLKKKCDSVLEKQWLDFLEERNLRLPDDAQVRIQEGDLNTVVDFWYEKERTAIYIDGPWHELPDRAARDWSIIDKLENRGIMVIRFPKGEQWLIDILQHPELFGKPAKKGDKE